MNKNGIPEKGIGEGMINQKKRSVTLMKVVPSDSNTGYYKRQDEEVNRDQIISYHRAHNISDTDIAVTVKQLNCRIGG